VFSGARGVAHGNTIVVITTNVKTKIVNELSLRARAPANHLSSR
jgi:hypothetical protein